jgi:hypothetical protein
MLPKEDVDLLRADGRPSEVIRHVVREYLRRKRVDALAAVVLGR